mmetsp:Transcript_15519/g.48772  ORF Transcript_15519/g.48772 Transcript_15519/m.48772 type:complete len:201 (-) Transcript_15519:97-699(-)
MRRELRMPTVAHRSPFGVPSRPKRRANSNSRGARCWYAATSVSQWSSSAAVKAYLMLPPAAPAAACSARPATAGRPASTRPADAPSAAAVFSSSSASSSALPPLNAAAFLSLLALRDSARGARAPPRRPVQMRARGRSARLSTTGAAGWSPPAARRGARGRRGRGRRGGPPGLRRRRARAPARGGPPPPRPRRGARASAQ